MADNDLEIRVRSSADLSALKEAQAAIDDIAERTRKVNFGALASERAATQAKFPGLFEGAGVPFGEGSGGAGVSGLTTVAADMDRVAQASLLVGVNLSRARNEAVTLVREIAAGAPTTRTLGALFGALGYQIAGLGIALGAPLFLTYKMIENEQKLNKELDDQFEKLNENAHAWQAAAAAATTPEDVQKVAKEAVPVLEEANKKVKELGEQGVSWWKQIIDSVTNIGGFGGTPFQTKFTKSMEALSTIADQTRKIAAAEIKVAEESEKAFDQSRVDGLIGKLKDLEDQQKKLVAPDGAVTDPKHFEELGTKIEAAKNKLKEFIQLDDARLKTADAAAKKLATDVQLPQAEFQKKQQDEFRAHMAERHALEIKQQEAEAIGDDATAKAIQEQLDKDTFRRDQAEEAGQRQLQLKRDIYSTPKGEFDPFSTPAGAPDQFDMPESALPSIYAQKGAERAAATGGRTDAGSEKIAKILNDIYRQWQ